MSKRSKHENHISFYRPNWKNITNRSINIIRNKATSIEDTFKKLNLKIIAEDIRNKLGLSWAMLSRIGLGSI